MQWIFSFHKNIASKCQRSGPGGPEISLGFEFQEPNISNGRHRENRRVWPASSCGGRRSCKSLRPAMNVYNNKTLRTSIIKINSNLRRAVRRFRCVPDASATRTGPDGSGNLLRPNEFPVVSGLRRIRIHSQTLLTRAWVNLMLKN